MIAAFRDDAISQSLAGDQGRAIASRMAKASPQLPALIAARTAHSRKTLMQYGAAFEQVIVLGVGIDTKPLTHSNAHQVWFLCDLREMLRDRAKRLRAQKQKDNHCVTIPVDFRMQGLSRRVLDSSFDPSKKTLVFFEGVSMYLNSDELQQTAVEVSHLLVNPSSLLWIDHVSAELLTMQSTEVTSFLAAMSRLGEPFTTGFSNPADFFESDGWTTVETVSAAQVLGDTDDPVFDRYLFSVVSNTNAGRTAGAVHRPTNSELPLK